MVVNSRFDKVLEASKAVSHKEGVEDERERQNLMRRMIDANNNLEALRESGSIPPGAVLPAVLVVPTESSISTVQAPTNVATPEAKK